MTGVRNIGQDVTSASDLVYQDYVNIVKGGDLTASQVDDLINSGLAGYASKTYVDAQDALNVTQTYVDTQDNLRVRTSQKDVAGGVPGLDSTGRVSVDRINLPTNQNYHRGPWSPAAYPATELTVTAETTIFTCGVTDPGFPYKLQVFGQIDARMSVVGEWPSIQVRDGSVGGPVVAQGSGLADTYQARGIDFFERTTTLAQGLGTDWSELAVDGSNPATDGAIIADGHDARWGITSGVDGQATKIIVARRISPVDAVTIGDMQIIRGTLGDFTHEASFGGPVALKCLVGRCNAAADRYVVLACSEDVAHLYYTDGTQDWIHIGSSGALGNPGPLTNTGNEIVLQAGGGVGVAGAQGGTDPYYYRADVIRTNGTVTALWNWTDTSHVTSVGASNRGWGIAMKAAGRGGGLVPRRPQSLARVNLDPAFVVPQSAPINIIPVSLGAQSARTGATTLYVRASRTGSVGNAVIGTYLPKLFVLAVPA